MTWLTLIPAAALCAAVIVIAWYESRELVDDLVRDVRREKP